MVSVPQHNWSLSADFPSVPAAANFKQRNHANG
jgi:hypothetical protein